MVDLHRHTEFSSFDGFGKPEDLAKIAKAKGHSSLSISDHGNVNGWVKHYFACKEEDIKPILGVECYYMPVFVEEKESFHLCLFAKNAQGYKNINRIMYLANKKNYYYRARVTDDLLSKYREGIICTSACVAGYASQCIKNDDIKKAQEWIEKMKSIFDDDFYIEIQPYKVSEEGLQELVNRELYKIACKLKVKCILTSDSHYGAKEDFDTYMIMHEIAKHTSYDIESTYKERYMPTEREIVKRFVKMHSSDFKDAQLIAHKMIANLEEIEQKIDGDILDKLEYSNLKAQIDIADSAMQLKKEIIKGLKSREVNTPLYQNRAKKEFAVIKENGFADYFLIVQDYVQWAKSKGIKVGPGRGSACNSLVAYALGITDVDAVKYGLDFERFLRKDKKKMPDIDLDFEIDRRDEVVSYICTKYKGKAAQICSYGLYKVDNALNDLFKVCGVFSTEEKDRIKIYVKSHISADESFDYASICEEEKCKVYNAQYNNVIKHFSKLYKKVRFIGTHAAGVAISGKSLLNYTTVEKRGGVFSCAYDLEDLEKLGILKFDILGLKTMSEMRELEELSGVVCGEDEVGDSAIYKRFRAGDTDGIFQFESSTVKKMLDEIHCDSFNDLRAANAMNRPGPLSLGMPAEYAHNKLNGTEEESSNSALSLFADITKDTYGTIIYQEQIMGICKALGMSNDYADKMMKIVKDQESRNRLLSAQDGIERDIKAAFLKGAREKGIKRKEAEKLFDSISVYSFNKGHATGYSIIGVQLMWYKIYYPEYFWLVKLKYANKENLFKYKREAVMSGSVILPPHVNGTARFSLTDKFGTICLQEGLQSIDGVGEKVAQFIEDEKEKGGNYQSYVDFKARIPKRIATIKVFNALENSGALCFKKAVFMCNAEQYNLKLYGRGRK